VDISELLAELAAAERKLSTLEHDAAAPMDSGCWPAWRILLCQSSDPAALAAWRQAHAASCSACAERCKRVLREAQGPRGVRTVYIPFDALCDRPMAYAASTAGQLGSPAAELPLVEYHRLAATGTPGVDSVWLVTWDHTLFVLVQAAEETLHQWRTGARMLDSEGNEIASLEPVGHDLIALLQPNAPAPGKSVQAYQCQLPLRVLLGQSFCIPSFLPQHVRLASRSNGASHAADIVTDLVSRNRVGRFLAGLPDHVEDPSRALTLSFYLRILLRQGRITDLDRGRLRHLDWLAQDIRDALGSGEDVEH